jgi:large subunit ribosomal protein L3
MRSKGLIGKKVGMTAIFTPDGRHIPVTVILAGPCVITQVKTVEKDGYNALQIGFGEKKESRTTKPIKGHFQKSGGKCCAFLKEVGVDNPEAYTPGQILGSDFFQIGERIDVVGTTKGRGFSGVMKRHGFSGMRATHGVKGHRVPGSIGCSAWPSKVIKGKKMPGHHGMERKTARNLEIVDIRPDDNLILIKGAVPGSREGIVVLNKLKFAPKS